MCTSLAWMTARGSVRPAVVSTMLRGRVGPPGIPFENGSPTVVSSDEIVARRFIRQLETLAGRVRGDKLFSDSIEGYLLLQESVFKLQMKLQNTISEVKRRGSKDPEVRKHLELLRHLRWQSRRLGDAIAWSALLYNRQVIHALTKNDPIPIPSAWSDGHRGAFQFARSLTSQEWGIPIIHDITNALRVGDITFMKPARRLSEAVFRTVELKTRRISEDVDEQGDPVVRLSGTAISNEPFPAFPTNPTRAESGTEGTANEPKGPPAVSILRHRPDRRIERQMARMDIATASKNAPIHQLTKIGDGHVFAFKLDEEQQPHWKELRRAIRHARRDGFAYFELGGFVGYSLIFNPDGVTKEDIQRSPMPDHVVGLMHEEIGERNSITVSTLADDEDDSFASKVLPFYLWEVPQRAIRDVLRHRLLITAAYNSGWMEKLLVDAGLTVIPEKSGRDRRGFEVVATFEWAGEAQVEYHSSVWEEMYVAVHEFRGPTAVIERALAPMSAPRIVSLDKFIPTEE